MKGLSQLYGAMAYDKSKGFTLAKTILASGPDQARIILEKENLKPIDEWRSVDDWLRFFFPSNIRPVYLFLDWRLLETHYWWFWMGSWQISEYNGYHPYLEYYLNVDKTQKGLIGEDFSLDRRQGILTSTNNSELPLKELKIIADGKVAWRTEYEIENGVYVDFFDGYNIAVAQDPIIAESVFSKLFIMHERPGKYFHPIVLNSPFFQLWQVNGDSYTSITND
jgi:hypothetical protein